jgi:hypothetical protein
MTCTTLLFLTVLQPVAILAFCTFTMTSMGDIRNDIEFSRRLLDENRFATKVAMERVVKLRLRPGSSVKEHESLQRTLKNLALREEEIRDELGTLLLIALREQIKRGA